MKPELWSPANPKLYQVIIKSNSDEVVDSIGFRSIEVQGNKVLLNQEPIFLKAVNIHEENPYKRARAFSIDDARILLESAKKMGCNLVRPGTLSPQRKHGKRSRKNGPYGVE